MTNDEAKAKLEARLKCMERNFSGCDPECNNDRCDECDLCYAQGTVGEQKEALQIAIKELEKSGWIPVSEKQPEESGYYLVTLFDTDCNCLNLGVRWFAHPDDYDIAMGEWRECAKNEKVTAWRSKIEPYKEESK